MQLADWISISFLTALVLPMGIWIYSRDTWYLKLVVGVLGANALVVGIKTLFGSHSFFGRPAGARGCDILCRGGAVGGVPGFPSGHMTTAAVVVSALWWHTHDIRVLWIGGPWVAAMAWARWAKQCHNWQQIIAGAALGTTLGWLLA